MAGTGSAQAGLAGGFVDFYDGAAGIPAHADDAALGTKILRVYNNAVGQPANTTGITLDNPVASAPDGVTLSKPAAEVWSGPGLATLQAAYFRVVAPGDTGAASTTQRRIQGLCGLAGSDANMLTLQVTNGVVATIDSFNWTLPAN